MTKSTRRWAADAGAGIALLSLLALQQVAQAQQAMAVASIRAAPMKDSFYVQPTDSYLASVTPGTVVRYRPLPSTALWSDVKEGWQIMYRSTDSRNQPVAMVTTLLTPMKVSSTGRKLVSYQAFYNSLTLNCSPSAQTLTKLSSDKLFYKGALTSGYYVNLPDYEGLQSQWLAAANTAHGVLDSIRAVLNFSNSGLNAATPVGLAGYSGGGFATVWAAELARSYAPELRIVGSAAGGVPANPINVFKQVNDTAFSAVYMAGLVGWSRAFPEMNLAQNATDEGRVAFADAGTRCLNGLPAGQPDMSSKYGNKNINAYLKDPNFWAQPTMQAINKENAMGQRIPNMPMLIWEGDADVQTTPADAAKLVQTYCAAGVTVQFDKLPAYGHVTGAIKIGDGLKYLVDRFNGKPAPTNCK